MSVNIPYNVTIPNAATYNTVLTEANRAGTEVASITSATNASAVKDLVERFAVANYSMGFTNGFILGLSAGALFAIYFIHRKV